MQDGVVKNEDVLVAKVRKMRFSRDARSPVDFAGTDPLRHLFLMVQIAINIVFSLKSCLVPFECN